MNDLREAAQRLIDLQDMDRRQFGHKDDWLIACRRARDNLRAALAQPSISQQVVDKQAEDEGLWFRAETASEAYLQQELRRLHAAVEGKK